MRPGTTPAAAANRVRAALGALDRADRRSLVAMYLLIAVLHLVGFGVLLGPFVPPDLRPGAAQAGFGAGAGLLAYTFGLRHAFDVDHIAAVDNTTRKLLGDRATAGAGRRPLSVGFWFSLGHSTVVFALVLLLAAGARALAEQVDRSTSTLHAVAGVVGPLVSGVFLWVLGCVNIAALVGAARALRRARRGDHDETEPQLHGIVSHLLGGLSRWVSRPWHIYPIGVLFGLGFDTATEVGLLVLAGGAAAVDLPVFAVVALPVLFAAGMCLVDTTDGVMMNAVYGWAFSRPIRRIYYNLSVTTISVVVALGVGTVELVGVLAKQADVRAGPLAMIAGLPLDLAGVVIAALFLVAWVVSIAVWRAARIEERWAGRQPAE